MYGNKTGFKVNYEPDIKRKKKKYLKTEPYICPECDRPWQPLYSQKLEYLDGFPRLGCSVKVCRNCK